jgi:hypothetical protein
MTSRSHIERAIEKIQDKAPAINIDFTQHRLDDGTTISTQERVVKDVPLPLIFPFLASSQSPILHRRFKRLQ